MMAKALLALRYARVHLGELEGHRVHGSGDHNVIALRRDGAGKVRPSW